MFEWVIDRVSLSLILLFMQVQYFSTRPLGRGALVVPLPCVKADFMRFYSSDSAAGDG